MATASMQLRPATADSTSAAMQHGFSPYVNNAGTVLAVSGPNFVVVAGDTRLSNGGYSISSRNVSKLFSINDGCVLATSGMQADAATLRKVLRYKATMYKHDHNKDISAPAVSQLLSNTLYYKRFFPYYTFNLCCGVDAKGVGRVYGYDAIGSFEEIPYGCVGSSMHLITSLLDNQVGFKTQPGNRRELSLEETVELVKDAITCACERDIYTGDEADIWIITQAGTQKTRFSLKRD
jgi:20S proteasome subunit beta 6